MLPRSASIDVNAVTTAGTWGRHDDEEEQEKEEVASGFWLSLLQGGRKAITNSLHAGRRLCQPGSSE